MKYLRACAYVWCKSEYRTYSSNELLHVSVPQLVPGSEERVCVWRGGGGVITTLTTVMYYMLVMTAKIQGFACQGFACFDSSQSLKSLVAKMIRELKAASRFKIFPGTGPRFLAALLRLVT